MKTLTETKGKDGVPTVGPSSGECSPLVASALHMLSRSD